MTEITFDTQAATGVSASLFQTLAWTKEENESHLAVPAAGPGGGAPLNPLRPKTFDDYAGQERVCANLQVYATSALQRSVTLDHCLLYGPPGLGKTTLAHILAHTMGSPFKMTSGPAIERPADLMGILVNLEPKTLLFIDEIHRLPMAVEEVLYGAMEDRRLDVIIGQGPSARTVELPLPAFTLVGATTRPGALSAPLRHRFGIVEHLEYYSPHSLAQIISRSAHILNCPITPQAALGLARRSRGTPRIANQLLRRVFDFALVDGLPIISDDGLNKALARLGIDGEGLQKKDRDFLRITRDRYNGGPVGLEAVAAALNEDPQTLEDVYEPYMVHVGFLARTHRGRMLTRLATDHLMQVERDFGAGF